RSNRVAKESHRAAALQQTKQDLQLQVATLRSFPPPPQGLLYSLYRITLVDEYEYAAMVTVDNVMAPLLCGTFLAASSILCVNLLIALLTDTFQRSEVMSGLVTTHGVGPKITLTKTWPDIWSQI
ncbi:hypothetical protein XENOCAPTIV_013597, partial [Xenoophorus captivus]